MAVFACTGTCSARDVAAVERMGAVAIDYRNEDFLARIHELTGGDSVDVVLDGFGGMLSPAERNATARPADHPGARPCAGGEMVPAS